MSIHSIVSLTSGASRSRKFQDRLRCLRFPPVEHIRRVGETWQCVRLERRADLICTATEATPEKAETV